MPSSPISAAKSEDALFKSTAAHELAGRTNKTPESIDREFERALIGLTPAPCIKGWTQEQILKHANTCGSGGHLFAVEVPNVVSIILSSPQITFPITEKGCLELEAMVAEHNGVPSDKICIDPVTANCGHQWRFFPETAPILTGFDYLV